MRHQFANESKAHANSGVCNFVFAANAYKVEGDETLVQLTPFGRFPNVMGMQVVMPNDAEAMANDFVANAQMLTGMGLPWFIGHPDHSLHNNRDTDDRSYGRIKGLEAKHAAGCTACTAFMANSKSKTPCREHGLFARVKFNDEGKRLIANEMFSGHSVNWQLYKVGNEYHPFRLQSVGFTNRPNIPVPSILSANEVLDDELAKKRFCRLSVMRWMANARVNPYLPDGYAKNLSALERRGKLARMRKNNLPH